VLGSHGREKGKERLEGAEPDEASPLIQREPGWFGKVRANHPGLTRNG